MSITVATQTKVDGTFREILAPFEAGSKKIDYINGNFSSKESMKDILSRDGMNCVQFVRFLVEEKCGIKLTQDQVQKLYIDYPEFANREKYVAGVQAALNGTDPRMKGVVNALVSGGYATEVTEPKEDCFVQVHLKGKQSGHSGVVTKVYRDAQGKVTSFDMLASNSTDDNSTSKRGTGVIRINLSEYDAFYAQLKPGVAKEQSSTQLDPAKSVAPSGIDVKSEQEKRSLVDSAISAIRKGERQSYIRIGSEGAEVTWLKEQLLLWGKQSGNLDASTIARLEKSVDDKKMTNKWADVVARFQQSVGLANDGSLIQTSPGDKRSLAADRVWGIRSQRALDLYFGRGAEAEAALSWESFKTVTGGIWSVQQQEAAGINYLDEDEEPSSNFDYSNTPSLSPKAKVGFVAVDPETLMQRGICKNFQEAKNVIAFLAAISEYEGTSSPDGYNTMYGGTTFSDMSGHPKNRISKGGYTSSAAGKYQFMDFTYDSLKMPNMQPVTQDLGAIALLERRGIMDDVKAGRFDVALARGAAAEWASLPRFQGDARGQYGQIRDAGRYDKVMSSIARYQQGVVEAYGSKLTESASNA